MIDLITEADVDPGLLVGQPVAVVGFGNQGHAQAQNLRDQGVRVTVGARPGAGADHAKQLGFEVVPIREAVSGAGFVVVTLPDEAIGDVYRDEVGPYLRDGSALVFAHGFAVLYGQVSAPAAVDVLLVSPKGAGRMLRREFVAGRGLVGLIAVHQDATGGAEARARAYGWGIGCARRGLIPTTFREETETDLFGEQVVLCGGIPELIRAAFDTLVEAGYTPAAAYLECVHEAKLITDLIYEAGLSGMFDRISDTAEFGGQAVGRRIIGPEARASMGEALSEIQSGAFARAWIAEAGAGKPELRRRREAARAWPVEVTGRALRPLIGLDQGS